MNEISYVRDSNQLACQEEGEVEKKKGKNSDGIEEQQHIITTHEINQEKQTGENNFNRSLTERRRTHVELNEVTHPLNRLCVSFSRFVSIEIICL